MIKQNLVMLPGYDGDGEYTFSKLVPLLANKFHCYAINYPFVHSIDKSYSLEQLDNYIYQQTKLLGLHQFHLLGFSLGGFIASYYLLRYPSQVLSLSLVSSSFQLKPSFTYQTLVRLAKFAFRSRYLAYIFTGLYRLPQLRWLTSRLPLPAPAPDFPIREGYPLFSTLANVLDESHKLDLSQLTESTQHKQSILFRDDQSFPAHVYAPLHAQRGFKVTVLPRGGHAESEDYWITVANTLKKELQ